MNKDSTKINKIFLTAYQQFLLQPRNTRNSRSPGYKNAFSYKLFTASMRPILFYHFASSSLSDELNKSAHQFHQIKFKQLARRSLIVFTCSISFPIKTRGQPRTCSELYVSLWDPVQASSSIKLGLENPGLAVELGATWRSLSPP